MKIKNISILLIFSLNSFLSAQINSNLFFQKKINLPKISNSDTVLYSIHLNKLEPEVLATSKIRFSLDLSGSYQDEAISHYQNYRDKISYYVSPSLFYQINDQFSLYTRVNIENIRVDYVYPEKMYFGNEFSNHRGGFEIAKLEYTDEHFTVHFGRDYFLPGLYFYENLLFSKYNYPYDQLFAAYRNDLFELSTYYLDLTTNSIIQRHLNGHRLSINLGKFGYLAFNDIMLYGGENKSIDLIAFNPLILFYPYHENKQNLNSNHLMSMEIFLKYYNIFIFTELLLDDFQIDKKVSGDLEPNEWGINTTLGINNLFKNFNWKINYTRVANRTYNVQIHDYEKYIYKNYPIGHFLGNNFWEMKTSLTYRLYEHWITDLTFYHLEYGDEALYGEFNTDYLDYTIKEGYDEDFPFGKVKNQTGFVIESWYNYSENFLFNGKISYWLNNNILKKDFNFSLGLAYRFTTSL